MMHISAARYGTISIVHAPASQAYKEESPLHQVPDSVSSVRPRTQDSSPSGWLARLGIARGSAASEPDVVQACHGEGCHRSIFDGSSEAILVFDSSTLGLLDANRASHELFRYSDSELSAMSLTDFAEVPQALFSRAAGDAACVSRQEMRRSDGSTFLGKITWKRVEFEGNVVHAAFIRDVTKHVKAAEAYAAAEMKFAAAFASSTDAISITRVDDGVYVEVNQGFCRISGHTAEDIVGRSCLSLDIWADAADRARVIERLLADGMVAEFEAGFRNKDGEVHLGLVSARVIELGGEPHVLMVTRDISGEKRTAEALELSNSRLEHMLQEMTGTLGRIVESRDPYTHGHQERVAMVSRAIAEEMGLPEAGVQAVEMAALVHDVGKLSVPAEILNRPGMLTDVEFGLIKTHSDRGHAILGGVDSPWPLADVVLQHHERMDGSGYPQGLKGEEIILPARIVAIADVVEAMASHRPYRAALGLDVAVTEVRNHPEKYDSDALAACIRLYESGALRFLDENFSDAQALGG
jgi:PAS domain S-box-containing protein